MEADHITPALYALCVTPLESPALFAAALAAVSPERREKALRLRQASDQRLSLGAGLLLRHALHQAGCDRPPGVPAYTAEGKPYYPDSGFFFSLSHSGDWALCAAAGFAVGCDVERVRGIDLKLSRRFHPEEAAALLALSAQEDRLDRFFRLWTLKESFMKAVGLGLTLPLDEFQIVFGAVPAVLQSVDERAYTLREYPDIPGYRCAVCAAGDWGTVKLQTVTADELLQ